MKIRDLTLKSVVVFLFVSLTTSCGSDLAKNRLAQNKEATEEEYQQFVKDLDQILTTHKDFAIKILRLPIMGADDIEGDSNAFSQEINRIFGLPWMLDHTKYASSWPRLWKEKGEEYRKRYILEMFEAYGNAVGDSKTPLSYLPSPMNNVRAFFDEEEIYRAAQALPYYAKGVEWNGVKERYDYKDQDLKLLTITVMSAIHDSKYRNRFRTRIEGETELLKKLRTNTKTSDLKTQFEPIDLFQSLLANFDLNLRYFTSDGTVVSPIIFQKLAHRTLHLYFGGSAEDDKAGSELSSLYVLREFGGGDKFSILCADGGLKNKLFDDPEVVNDNTFITPEDFLVKTVQLEIFSLVEKDKLRFDINCEDKTYSIDIKNEDSDPIPFPKEYNIEEFRAHEPIRVVIPFALTEEIDKKARFLFHRYMNYYGFRHLGEKKNILTKPMFHKRALSADVIIPVAHSLDVNKFQLGTKTSVMSRYYKRFKKKGSKRVPVIVDIFYPQKKVGETVDRELLDTDDLAQIFHQRRYYKNTPLLIFNNSCFAQNALWTWMKAYRKSADLSLKSGLINSFEELVDAPHVIASKGGFPTSTTADVLSNVRYPFAVMKEIAEGRKPAQVFETLKDPKAVKKDPLVKAIQKIISWRNKSPIQDADFKPVYNVNYPKLFEMGGFKILLKDPETGGVTEY